MPQYYMVLTAIGAAKKANKEALGQSLVLTEFACADGNGAYVAPDETWDATDWEAANEVYRASINSIYQHADEPTWLVTEGVVTQDEGGFYIRLVGIFDADGDLIMVGAYPQTYKPTLAEGATRDIYVRAITEIGSAAAVTLKIDPSVVLATRAYVDALLRPAFRYYMS